MKTDIYEVKRHGQRADEKYIKSHQTNASFNIPVDDKYIHHHQENRQIEENVTGHGADEKYVKANSYPLGTDGNCHLIQVPKPHNKTPIPIFIGASDHPADRIQEKILLYTLHKNSSRPLKVTFLRPSMFPGVSSFGWGTPFTGLRYVIPKLMGFKGNAIYMDMDMINFRDIAEFYSINMLGRPFAMVYDSKLSVKGGPRGGYCDSMMMMDCSQTHKFFNWEECHSWGAIQPSFKWIFMERIRQAGDPNDASKNNAVVRLDSRWNCFDGDITDGEYDEKNNTLPEYPLDNIFHLHLTALSYQPWHSPYLMSAKATHRRRDITDYWWSLVDEVRDLEI